MGSRVRRIASLILGIASAILSFWMLGFFLLDSAIIHFTPFTQHTGQSWRSFVFVLTRPDQIVYCLGCLGIAAILGVSGLWLVRGEPRGRRAVTVGASAGRFCRGGLLGVALDVAVILGLFAYRWLV